MLNRSYLCYQNAPLPPHRPCPGKRHRGGAERASYSLIATRRNDESLGLLPRWRPPRAQWLLRNCMPCDTKSLVRDQLMTKGCRRSGPVRLLSTHCHGDGPVTKRSRLRVGYGRLICNWQRRCVNHDPHRPRAGPHCHFALTVCSEVRARSRGRFLISAACYPLSEQEQQASLECEA
jgi:hypothetical protein